MDDLQTYLETIWHRADDDADAARVSLLLDLIAALSDPTVRAFAQSRAEPIARRSGVPPYDEWRAARR